MYIHDQRQLPSPCSSETSIPRLDDWERIQRTTAIWYGLISNDDHKDHDCHFTMSIRFSYEGTYTIRIAHDGQVAPAWEEQHSSLTTAMRQLLLRICRQILCECTPREEEDRVIRSSREHARATVSQVMSGITG